ncbi:MAG: hypothetical protein ACE5WD_13400 [Candidatus Aminicenantia bacterium]
MAKIIKNIGQTQRKVDAKIIAKSLGAEKVKVKIDTKQGPISLFSLRQFLISRLRSSGGRPALVGTTEKRNKIPLFNEDWDKLKVIAKYYKEKEGINVSPSQIASALLHIEISEIDISKLKVSSKG